MANLKQTSVTGSSGTTSLFISGSSIVMPSMSGSVDSGTAAQMYVDITPTAGLTMKLTQAGSFGSQNSPYTCLGAWSIGGNMINSRTSTSGTGFSVDSLLTAGGNDGSAMNETEEYNGSSWSAGGALSISRWTQLTGTQNAAIAGGGATPTRLSCTEEYDGASWSTGGAMNYAHADGAFSGQQNAGAYFGGYIGGPSLGTCTEFYNGTAWSNGPATPSNTFGGQAQGSISATTLLLGGTSPSAPAYGASTCAIDFDGTSYNAITSLLFCHAVGGGYGDSSDNMGVAGGCTHGSNGCKTEEWHGISWSLLPDVPNANRYLGGGGNINGSGAGIFGGGPVESVTQQFTKVLTNPFTYNSAVSSDSWSGATNMIQASRKPGGAVTQNAALSIGGSSIPAALNNTEEFDGSTWTAGGTLSIARCAGAGGGTQNAAFFAGGAVSPTKYANTEEYNGSSWSPGGAMITARTYAAGGGTQNAGLALGGYTPTVVSCIEEYNGSSWSTAGALSIARYGNIENAGTSQNDGVAVGGYPSSTTCASFEIWNGSSSTTGPNLVNCSANGAGGVESSDDIIMINGGIAPYTLTQKYNGTSWSISFPLTGYAGTGASIGAGSGTAAVIFGGLNGPAAIGNTYLFNQPTNVCSTTPFCIASSWSTGGALIKSRQAPGTSGTPTAGLVFGGLTSTGGNDYVTDTEEYNGTSWSAGGALSIARCAGGSSTAGTQNAALYFTGLGNSNSTQTSTEEYNGTSWSPGGSTINAVYSGYGAGTQNSAIRFGGYVSPADTTTSEEYNGTSWSAGGAMNIARRELGGAGASSNAAVAFGGNPTKSDTEEYNGTAWVATNSMNTGRRFVSGNGTVSDALAIGGNTPSTTNKTERFNGITWSNVANLNVERNFGASAGTANSTFFVGGTPANKCVEEFVCANYQVGVWSGEAPLITGRSSGAGAGVTNAALAFGGNDPVITTTEEWNGKSWSVGGALIVGARYMGGTGLQDATLKAAGYNGSSYINNTEEYDGTSWTAGPTTINSKATMGLTGIQNAAVMFGGEPTTNTTEEYNGSAWSAGNTMITAIVGNSGVGTQNASLSIGGYTPTTVATVEQYNGTTWSSSVALNIARRYATAFGTSNSAINAGGNNNASCSSTEEWNGIGWSSRANILIARPNLKSSQNSLSSEGIIFTGSPGLNTTSKWSVSNPVNRGIYSFTKMLGDGAVLDSTSTTSGGGYGGGY